MPEEDIGLYTIPEDEAERNCYRIKRPVRYRGVLFTKGTAVEFTDPETQTIFIRRNYV